MLKIYYQRRDQRDSLVARTTCKYKEEEGGKQKFGWLIMSRSVTFARWHTHSHRRLGLLYRNHTNLLYDYSSDNSPYCRRSKDRIPINKRETARLGLVITTRGVDVGSSLVITFLNDVHNTQQCRNGTAPPKMGGACKARHKDYGGNRSTYRIIVITCLWIVVHARGGLVDHVLEILCMLSRLTHFIHETEGICGRNCKMYFRS